MKGHDAVISRAKLGCRHYVCVVKCEGWGDLLRYLDIDPSMYGIQTTLDLIRNASLAELGTYK